jgi:hypothetical protein
MKAAKAVMYNIFKVFFSYLNVLRTEGVEVLLACCNGRRTGIYLIYDGDRSDLGDSWSNVTAGQLNVEVATSRWQCELAVQWP